jgi:enoyl-CoA hydratase/carnithine racemase
MSASDVDTTTGIAVEDVGRVRVITLNRPQVLNALTIGTFDVLREAVVAAGLDSGVGCVVLTGAGRGFCTGQDLQEMAAPVMPDDGKRHGFIPCIEEIERFPKPIVAAVNGVGVGFGATVLLHCDIVLMADSARLQFPFVPLGLAPEAGSSLTLPMAIGHQEAAALLLTGDWLSAADAVRTGLALRTVPLEDLRDEALALAGRIAAMPLPSVVATKQLLIAHRVDAIRAARAREIEVFARLLGGPANVEAITAFMQKRAPDFGAIEFPPTLW